MICRVSATYRDDLFKPLVIDNFAGGGGAGLGIEQAIGRPVDHAINHDAQALAMHRVNHPGTTHWHSDVWEVDPLEVTQGRPVGLAWFSPDCFPCGSLVLTSNGYIPIEDVKVGDQVLTHEGRYRRVTDTLSTVRPLVKVTGQGHPGLLVSPEHPFYIRNANNVFDNSIRRYRRTLGDPTWINSKHLRTSGAPLNAAGGNLSFWATPCQFPSLSIPKVGGRGMKIDIDLMWLAGRYVGDGWTRLGNGRAELVITCSKLERDGLKKRLSVWPRIGQRSGFNEISWYGRETGTAYQFSTGHQGLVQWLRAEFGHLAHNKNIPAWLLGANEPLRRAFVDGYISADGHTRSISGGDVVMASTVSKLLVFGLRSLAESLGYSANVTGPLNNRNIIEGRKVNARPMWSVRWREYLQRAQTVRDGRHNWLRIQSVVDQFTSATLYNIAVEQDESYIVEGCVVHNCTHHSKARGGKPTRDDGKKSRGLAWVVTRWAGLVRPDVIMLENVEEFRQWGPLTRKRGRAKHPRACKFRKGTTFDRFIQQLEKLGYVVEHRELRACDYGAPTIRKRLFLIARCDGQPIIWPEATHGAPTERLAGSDNKRAGKRRGKDDDLEQSRRRCQGEGGAGSKRAIHTPSQGCSSSSRTMGRKAIKATQVGNGAERSHSLNPYRTAAECIDWSIPCPSIFERKRPLADNTLRRIAAGIKRYVIESAEPFLVTYYGPKNGYQSTSRGLDEPVRTLTTENRLGLVVPSMISIANYGGNGSPANSIEMPLTTVTANPKGGHHALVSAFIAKHYGGQVGCKIDTPLPTTTTRGTQNQLVAAHLTHMYTSNTNGGAGDLNDPLKTVTAGGLHAGLVAALLIKYYGNEHGGYKVDEPIHTIPTKDRYGLVTVNIDGETYVITDIGMRMLQPRELYRAQGFDDDYIIDRGIDDAGDEISLTKTAQVKMCGNSVAPPVAAALVRANVVDSSPPAHFPDTTKMVGGGV